MRVRGKGRGNIMGTRAPHVWSAAARGSRVLTDGNVRVPVSNAFCGPALPYSSLYPITTRRNLMLIVVVAHFRHFKYFFSLLQVLVPGNRREDANSHTVSRPN